MFGRRVSGGKMYITTHISIYIYIMIINLSGDDDDVVWVCGVCVRVRVCAVCSLQHCRRDGIIHIYIYMSMVCVSLKRRIG